MLVLVHVGGGPAWAGATIPDEAISALANGRSVDLIVEYEATAVDQEAKKMRRASERFETDAISAHRAQRYAQIKSGVDLVVSKSGVEHLRDYSHLPMAFKRVRSITALQALAGRAEVRALYLDKAFHRVGTPNLNLVKQPAAAGVGYLGAGTTVAVLDDGIDYTNPAFGGCTAPGVPASCLVSVSQTVGSGTTDNSHGTNVSAIVLGVAPASRVAMLNVFSGTVAYTSNILTGINWAISNRSTYNIVAINMSLGDGSKNTTQCANGNPYRTPVNNAAQAGITVVAAAGNDAYTNALSAPACTPGIVSVGAVYDDNFGGLTWGNNLCTDATTAADQVACFSDSASYLTLLAPGALITAAGITEGGTSQASPHVAGTVAVLRSAFPNDTLSTTLARLTTSDTKITDPRNGLVKPRLDLQAAARPANDGFGSRTAISGTSGATSGTNRLATAETGEPSLTAGAGGHTVWWRWTAPASGQVSLDTHGSGFDTALAVYTGSAVNALTSVASNDNDGGAGGTSGLLFEAQSGVEYEIVVDGIGAAEGGVALNWSLNTNAQANLSGSLSGPTQPAQGSVAAYTITVNNAGPQTATNVAATLILPAGVSLSSGASNCTVSGSDVICNFGSLAANATASATVSLLWNASVPEALLVSVNSDVPDATLADNTSSLQVASTADSTDAPTLPQWGAIALGGMLVLLMARRPAIA